MPDNFHLDARDLPIVKLVPRGERKVSKKDEQRLRASMQAVGLLEPLVVFEQGELFSILDGQRRYEILLEWGIEVVPCLVWKEKESLFILMLT